MRVFADLPAAAFEFDGLLVGGLRFRVLAHHLEEHPFRQKRVVVIALGVGCLFESSHGFVQRLLRGREIRLVHRRLAELQVDGRRQEGIVRRILGEQFRRLGRMGFGVGVVPLPRRQRRKVLQHHDRFAVVAEGLGRFKGRRQIGESFGVLTSVEEGQSRFELRLVLAAGVFVEDAALLAAD